MAADIKPKIGPIDGQHKDLTDLPLGAEPTQLRKVLYPTYFSREPFGEF